MSLHRLLVLACVISAAAASPVASQSIGASQNHTCAISASGEMYCWGANRWKQPSRISYDSTPMPMVDSTRRFTTVGVGWLHDCAVDLEGRVWCAGVNSSGEMGRDPHLPCEFCGRPDTVSSPLRFRSVVTGRSHSCALTAEGKAYCWGSNDAGQAGTGDRVEVIYWPTAVVGNHRWKSLAAGDRHTCGITTEGRVLCWGANSRGQLGYVQERRAGCNLPDRCMAVPYPIADDTTRFASIYAGYDKSCGVTPVGQMHCWGVDYSRTGDSARASVHIATNFAIASMAIGYGSSCALAYGGDAYCWRESSLGTVGSAGFIRGRNGALSLTDQPVNTTLKFIALAAGEVNACGIATDGGVYCWGRLDVASENLSCHNAGCSATPVRVGGDLNLLKPVRAKR
jgi:alpha-tubulin suppressor-like RCC1 family protein